MGDLSPGVRLEVVGGEPLGLGADEGLEEEPRTTRQLSKGRCRKQWLLIRPRVMENELRNNFRLIREKYAIRLNSIFLMMNSFPR